MTKIVILHFAPLEMYPPMQNMIHVLRNRPCKNPVYIFTTKGGFEELDLFDSGSSIIKIMRFGKSGQDLSTIQRMLGYFLFHAGSSFYLLWFRPHRVLYYETLSAFPAWLYRRFINTSTEIFTHYHEYTTPAEYAKGMRLTKLFHRMEKWLYPRSTWLSHTNNFRMDLFIKDILPVIVPHPQVLPNYPPRNWFRAAPGHAIEPLRVVYSGALGMDTMYTREFSTWVLAQDGKVVWDIYSYNLSGEVRSYLESLNTPFIQLKKGVNYDNLPDVLKQYDVGVILYTGHIQNYVLNAPNKLFEYLTCGLDVWYPETMKGVHAYNTVSVFPKVVPLNFKDLQSIDLFSLRSRLECQRADPKFAAEAVYENLAHKLCV